MGFAVNKADEQVFFEPVGTGKVVLTTSAHTTVHQLDGSTRIELDYDAHGGHTDVELPEDGGES